jgi:hypothetical protein
VGFSRDRVSVEAVSAGGVNGVEKLWDLQSIRMFIIGGSY